MTEYLPALQPWAHQDEALERAWMKPYFAFLMEMGTGKTKVVIDEILRLYCMGYLHCALIIAPKGVYENWVRNELPTHIPEYLRSEVSIVMWHSGGGNSSQQREVTRHLEPSPLLRILVMNIEAFSTGKLANAVAQQFLNSGEYSYCALDESTFIKSPTATRTKNIIDAGKFANFRRIMSGMPVPRGPLDLWSQAEFLQRSLLGDSWYSHRARYAVLKEQWTGKREDKKGRKYQVIVSYKNIEQLADRILPWSYRVTKEQCLTLPPKVYTRRIVDLTPEQERIYSDLREFAYSELERGGAVSTTSVITQILRLQQLVCGHITSDEGEVQLVPSNRVPILMEVLQEVAGKAIIWSKFRPDVQRIVEAIVEEYGPESVAQFHGGNTATRGDDAHRFMNDPSCRFMVASYAGGHGNTWTVADTVIYYSNDYDLEKRAQSEDRAHRGGQTADRVTYVDLVTPGTVDERIIEALRKKIDIAAAIVGDGYREWLV